MKLLAVVMLFATVCVVAQPEPCSQYATCPDCVTHQLCGWCSEPVVYPNNKTGTQCAGFDPNGTIPFSCNGIFSTDQCVQGYVCNLTDFVCDLGPPGGGSTLAVCEANCTNNGQVYLCNTTTQQCYQVPSGTPGAASYAICMASCTHPSAKPSSSSPGPAPPPAGTYICNYTSGLCVNSTPGHGSSLQVCEESCSISNQSYMCNTFLDQCVKLPVGVHGETLAQCLIECNPSPNPGPPPMFMGMWRTIEIQNGYKVGEWDMNFSQSLAVIIDVAGASTIKGIPYNVKSSANLEMWINVTSGPGAGSTIKCIGQTANRGPETMYLTGAFGAAGGPAPSSITSAMTDGSSKVFFMSQCAGTPECVFHMPATQRPHQAKRSARHLKTFVDPCSQYGDACQDCVSHQYCGWCSTDVIYKDGQKGTQCAGVDPNPNASNAFICNGRYSTFNCSTGYDCDTDNNTCVPDPVPGNGIPLNECQEICRPTPAPSLVPQYVCNITTKQCYKCNQTYCPGSMPLATCEAACVNPKPGPSGLVVGSWRGLQIQNNYPLGEYEWLFNASGVKVYFQDALLWSGDVVSMGGDVMIVHIDSGAGAGTTISMIYTVQNQGTGLYAAMTLAVGAPNGGIPQDYQTPMVARKQYELVLAKCNNLPCKFVDP